MTDYKVHQETIRFGSGLIYVTDWKTGKRFYGKFNFRRPDITFQTEGKGSAN